VGSREQENKNQKKSGKGQKEGVTQKGGPLKGKSNASNGGFKGPNGLPGQIVTQNLQKASGSNHNRRVGITQCFKRQ